MAITKYRHFNECKLNTTVAIDGQCEACDNIVRADVDRVVQQIKARSQQTGMDVDKALAVVSVILNTPQGELREFMNKDYSTALKHAQENRGYGV